MECVEPGYTEGHEWKAEVPAWRASAGAGPVGRQHGAGDVGALRLGVGAGGRGSRAADHLRDDLGSRRGPSDILFPQGTHVHDDPFMNEMDEISYWVYTKRAPCLMNYDNIIKKQNEAAQNAKLLNDTNLTEAVPSPKKKKRKLSLLDDCASVQKQQNLYFETSQQRQRTVPSSCKSETLESEIDFNIKNSSVQDKPKRMKKQKSTRTLHKKNKVVTSTPLRRSQRRTQNGTCNNTQINVSFDTYNCSYLNGITDQSNSKIEVKVGQRSKKSLSKIPVAETSSDKKNSVLIYRSKHETVPKEQFEDLSDVSGFTANYIRSTKLHSNTKPHRSLRSKSNRNLVKESQPNVEAETEVPSRTTMLICVNKAVNATADVPNTEAVLNCSTDSSQNVINLITTQSNDRNDKVSKSTSLLKFVDVKLPKPRESHSCEKGGSKQISTTDMDISFQSISTANSRYPKRQRKNNEVVVARTSNTLTRASLDKRKKANKGVVEFNDSERKENPDDATVSRTRSGRSLTLALRHPENSLIVYSNSTEKVSTVNTLNVASQPRSLSRSRSKLKRVSHLKSSMDASDLALHRDSVREKSGFAACFSDSDDDSDALKQRKFFC